MDNICALINGEWLAEGTPVKSLNPATQEIVGVSRLATAAHVADAVKAARDASGSWAAKSVWERGELIGKAAALLLERRHELRHLITAEMGKVKPEADIEVLESVDMLRFYGEDGKSALDGEVINVNTGLFPDKASMITYEPLGVVAIIKPWNYPLELPLWSIGAALLCGNTIVFKPSEHSPLVGAALCRAFHDAGFPPGVVNLVLGGPDIGAALVDADVDMVSFTGSLDAGRMVGTRCGERGIRVSLELGGKDAFIVAADANLDAAVNGAVWGAFTNCGQVCTSAERFYVARDVADEFIRRVVEKARALRVGNGERDHIDMGPLVSKHQRSKVEAQVAEALQKGARALCGAGRPQGNSLEQGYFYMPTVLVDVRHDMAVMREETFGPVVPIVVVDSFEEAIAQANDTPYGLGASVWTRSVRNAQIAIRSLRTGMVWINDINVAFPQCPWGGVKASGHGRELSRFGVREYAVLKHVSIDWGDQPTRPWWYPYGVS